MERMSEAVPDSNDQAFHHFLSKSPWPEDTLIEKVALDVDSLIGGQNDTCLLVDESGFPKKGKKSVGVARQYCGELGKVDNSQVGVFGALANRHHVIPIDCRLYLPQSWTDDKQRCMSVEVPEWAMEYQRKQDLALQIVLGARAIGLRYNWIGFDAFYGCDPSFLRFLDNLKETFVGDVHCDQRIYLADPVPYLPSREGNRGRNPTKLKTDEMPVRVDEWAAKQSQESWKSLKLRKTSKGNLKVDILHRLVWLWDGEESKAHQWHLIVRKDKETRDIKYSLSNSPHDIQLERLAFMQCQRYLVEKVFKEGKNQFGMGDYQARGWRSWYHHMAMVMMAMLFMAEIRHDNEIYYPLMSCADVVEIFRNILPNRITSENEILRQLEERHRRRKSAIESAYRKQKMQQEIEEIQKQAQIM